MNDWRYDRGSRHDVVTIPLIWVAFVLSLAVHIAALWILMPTLIHNLSDMKDAIGKSSSALAVRLEPKPAPPPAPSQPASQPPVVAQAAPPRVMTRPVPKPKPAAPVIAMPKPEAALPAPQPAPPVQTPPPAVAPKPIEGDLASYIEARRRARGEMPSAPASNPVTSGAGESDDERRNRIIAANLGLSKPQTFGYDPKSAGGIFQIEHLSYEYADFYFFGMNKDIGRNTKQLIEVKRGSESDIKIAVVRKMITIIRDNVTGDFVWMSRHGPVTMSARLGDNGELEHFMLNDIFPDERAPR